MLLFSLEFEQGDLMLQVKEGDTISVHYTGKLDDGTVFDSSVGREPLQFTVGAHEVIPGFEEGALGMQVGDKREIIITPDHAYGPYVEELVKVLPRSAFPANINPAIGFEFAIQLQSGDSIPVRIIDIEGDE